MPNNCLVVAYNKPIPFSKLLDRLDKYFDNILIHIDHSLDNDDNLEVMQIAREFYIKSPEKYQILVQAENKGSCYGPIEAFVWFFSQYDHGFIFEEDCLPSTILFNEMCNIPKDRLFCFSNFSSTQSEKLCWLESRLFNSWGWACPKSLITPFLQDFTSDTSSQITSAPIFLKNYFSYLDKKHMEKDKKTWWDFQLIAYFLNSKTIVYRPSINLIENEGISELGAHTKYYDPHQAKLSLYNKNFQKLLNLFLRDVVFTGDLVNWLKFGLVKILYFSYYKK